MFIKLLINYLKYSVAFCLLVIMYLPLSLAGEGDDDEGDSGIEKTLSTPLLLVISPTLSPITTLVTSYDALPEDVKLHILEYCDVPTLGRTAQLSHSWKRAAENNTLWKPTGILHRPINNQESLKDYAKEHQQLMVSAFPTIYWHLWKKKIKNLIWTNPKIAYPNPTDLDPLERAIQLSREGRDQEALLAFWYVSDAEIMQPLALSALSDSLYFTGQKEESKKYYEYYYKNIKGTAWNDCKVISYTLDNDIDHLEIVLEAGADPEQRDDFSGDTALILATQYNYAKVVGLLLKYKANLYAQSNTTHLTAFDFMVKNLHLATVCAFLDARVDVNARDTRYGSTALMFAVKQRNMEVIELLLNRGADPYLQSLNNDETAFHLAQDNLAVYEKLWNFKSEIELY